MKRFAPFEGTDIAYHAWGAPTVVLHHGFIVDAHHNWVNPGVVDALVAAARRMAGIGARRDDPWATRPEVLANAVPGGRLHLVDGDHLTALRAPDHAPILVGFRDRPGPVTN